MTEPRALRVALVEDQERFRHALQAVLDATPDLCGAGAHHSVEDLERALVEQPERIHGWDLVLMDLDLPGRNGIDGTRLIKERRPDLPVLVCTVFEDSQTVQEAIRAGADGYLVKRTPLPRLLDAIRTAARGDGAPVSPTVARSLLELARGTPNPASEEAAPSVAIRVRIDGSAVCTPERDIDLRRRRAVRRLLAALARQRIESPGQPLSFDACIAAGWPDERILPEAARARLWSAIKALRDLGLEPVLETVGEGYRLVPTDAVVVERRQR